jgi:hypothetical protein
MISAETIKPSPPEAFAGDWEAVSDDGTSIERAHIEITDDQVQGVLQSLERGYFSGRLTMNGEVYLQGRVVNGMLDLTVTSGQESQQATKGRAFMRGQYLVVENGEFQSAYARPGVSLVQSADGSHDAELLAHSVTGMIYSSSTSASGRGAFVGGRLRLALCSDGTVAYDKSDVATTGGADGVDMGDGVSRRGHWSIVLFAGAPAIRAEWEGTGTSYSLTRYFRVEPYRNGSGARIDGTSLAVDGSC